MGLLKIYIVTPQKSIQFQYWFNTTPDFKDSQIKAYHSSENGSLYQKLVHNKIQTQLSSELLFQTFIPTVQCYT